MAAPTINRMLTRLKALLRRSDLLLIGLTLLVSGLLMARYGAPVSSAVVAEQEAVPEPVEEEGESLSVAKAGAAVRFLMYNAHNYHVSGDVARARHERKIKPIAQRNAVAESIAQVKPEIVGLIEMGGPAALDDLAERLEKLGLSYPHRKVLTRYGQNIALALLSRHPFAQDHSKADCPLVGQTNKMMLRGILDVTVSLADQRKFRIMGVHLKSRVDDNPAAALAQRSREARTLAAHVQHAMRQQPEMPILVFGDWNDGPGAQALSAVTQAPSRELALKRLNPKDEHGESWTFFYKAGNEYSTLDQIYVNSVLSRRMGSKSKMGIVSELPQKVASDHRAVWCDLH